MTHRFLITLSLSVESIWLWVSQSSTLHWTQGCSLLSHSVESIWLWVSQLSILRWTQGCPMLSQSKCWVNLAQSLSHNQVFCTRLTGVTRQGLYTVKRPMTLPSDNFQLDVPSWRCPTLKRALQCNDNLPCCMDKLQHHEQVERAEIEPTAFHCQGRPTLRHSQWEGTWKWYK